MKRLGFIGIIIEDKHFSSDSVNHLLSEHSHLILARTGIPDVKESKSVITLIINANTDELGQLTGKLGNLKGVSVKSGLSNK